MDDGRAVMRSKRKWTNEEGEEEGRGVELTC